MSAVITPHQAKYFATILKLKKRKGEDALPGALVGAKIDLNPHQIEAARFALEALHNHHGVLLADEVGLGKTIEAGLVISQHWAEKRRRILVICPASLRKQWCTELREKFHLPALVLDRKEYDSLKQEGQDPLKPNPEKVLIMSFHFAFRIHQELAMKNWDLAVIDEAHKLRNIYRGGIISRRIYEALLETPKVLLTATPFQNSLLELYGLSLFLDEELFGDKNYFISSYVHGQNLEDLKNRLRPYTFRTLRSQVTHYVHYTNRIPLTINFTPTKEEREYMEAVSDFLRRDDLISVAPGHRHITLLVLYKLLASSPVAIAGAFEKMRERLEKLLKEASKQSFISISTPELIQNIEEDLPSDIEEKLQDEISLTSSIKASPEKIQKEINELNYLINKAHSLKKDSKAIALLTALERGFEEMRKMGAPEKAVIFTESKRTQKFLFDFLSKNGYEGEIITFNGENKEPHSLEIYKKWVDANIHTDKVTGNKAVDMRTALVEHFKNHGRIFIATEAAAEGLNLQFASLVINYDLPWNPWRVEQRIGRCHRYGQRHDVVVINFLNEENLVERRVLELMAEKFRLFEGVFGASDEILGAIESGIDFEKKILEIYRTCRTPQEIEEAFKELQRELDKKIKEDKLHACRILNEYFEDEVKERFSSIEEVTDRYKRMLWQLTQFILGNQASFSEANLSFKLYASPAPEIPAALYYLGNSNSEAGIAYHLSHPLAEYVIEKANRLNLSVEEITFKSNSYPGSSKAIGKLRGKSGWLRVDLLSLKSLDEEEFLVLSGIDDDMREIDADLLEKLFLCDAVSRKPISILKDIDIRLKDISIKRQEEIRHSYEKEAMERFEFYEQKIEKWAEDKLKELEKKVKKLKMQINYLKRAKRRHKKLELKVKCDRLIRRKESELRRLRQDIIQREDEIYQERDRRIQKYEKLLNTSIHTVPLFTIRWKLV